MKKLRVVHIVPMLSPGGAERVAVHIATGLDRDRYEAVVVSLAGRVGCELDDLLDDAGIGVRYLGKHRGFDYHAYARVHRTLRELEPNVIHTHLHVLRYALPSMRLLGSVASLHTVHNLAEREIERGMRWIQQYAFNHGVVPVAVGEEVARSLKRLYKLPHQRIIPNGIPVDLFSCPKVPRREWRAREGFREESVLFVCVARFASQKNHALLVRSFAQGLAPDSRVHLVLVGEGQLQREIEELTRALAIEKYVHFLGLRTDIPDILAAADVFVLSSDYEGNPLSVMEAMAAGLPVIGTSAGGTKDIVEDGVEGYLVPPGDAQTLSKTMMFLMANRETRQVMGNAAMRRARKQFSVSTMVRSYEELYEDLICQPGLLSTEHKFSGRQIHANRRTPADEGGCTSAMMRI